MLNHRAVLMLTGCTLACVCLSIVLLVSQAYGASTGAVDALNGTFSTSVPIAVPVYHGLEPSLELVYNSATPDGWLGIGWSLKGLSSIRRSSQGGGTSSFGKHGLADVFYLDGGELMPCTKLGGTHCTKVQSFSRVTYNAMTDTWTVTGTNGNVATYVSYYKHGNSTYQWNLASVRNTLGQQVSYNYACEGTPVEYCYLSSIAYNGVSIQFTNAERRYPLRFAQGGQNLNKLKSKLTAIDVSVGNKRARIYRLNYARGWSLRDDEFAEKLTSVTQYGRDGVSSLPPLDLGYSENVFGLDAEQRRLERVLPSCSNAAALSHALADVNGDARADAIEIGCFGVNVALATSSGGFESVTSWTTQFSDAQARTAADFPRALGDVNGDGRADVVAFGEAGVWVSLSTRTSFSPAKIWQNGFGSSGSAGGWSVSRHIRRLADVNGDGKLDLVGFGDNGVHVALSTGTSFGGSGVWVAGFGTTSGSWSNIDHVRTTADVNGDGRADIVGFSSSGVYVSLSSGTSFSAPVLWSSSYGTGNGWLGYATTRTLADVNGDGLDDIVGFGMGDVKVALSTGSTFLAPEIWSSDTFIYQEMDTAPDSFRSYGWKRTPDLQRTLADINGDGLADLVVIEKEYVTTSLSTGIGFEFFAIKEYRVKATGSQDNARRLIGDINGDGNADIVGWTADGIYTMQSQASLGTLVTSVDNRIGSKTTITYAPSSAWDNTYLPPGLVLPSVSALTIEDGRGNTSTQQFSYAGANWSDSERRFLGFRKATTVLDAAGTYSETFYYQKEGGIVKPEVTYVKDAHGRVYHYTSYEYQDNTEAPYTSMLSARWDFQCNLRDTKFCRQVLTQFGYDQYSNVIMTKEHGDYNRTGDERLVVRGYYPNTATHLVGLPAYENRYSGHTASASNLYEQTTYLYDDNATYERAPTVGLTTEVRKWDSSTGRFVNSKLAYDSHGNVVSTTDERGAKHISTFDSEMHLFETKSCNALSQCETKTWDAVLGVELSRIDARGVTTKNSYDAFGRVTMFEVQSGTDHKATTKLFYRYPYSSWDTSGSSIMEIAPDGTSVTRYLDGLGRIYKTRRMNKYDRHLVIELVEYLGASNRVSRRSLPHPENAQGSIQWVTFQYDGVGRQRVIIAADGTRKEVVYSNDDHGVPYELSIDELGRNKTIWRDAEGRVSEVLEGGDRESSRSLLTYDVAGNLIRTVDGLGSVSTHAWDSLGRKVRSCDANMGCWSYRYDDGGLLIEEENAKGEKIAYEYDLLRRLVVKTVGPDDTIRWEYDQDWENTGESPLFALNRVSRVTYAHGEEHYAWDWQGLPKTVIRCVDSVCEQISFVHDDTARLQRVTYPDGEQVAYRYDEYGRLLTVGRRLNGVDTNDIVGNMEYDSTGKLARIAYGGGYQSQYTYDADHLRLKSAQVDNYRGDVLYDARYTYDAAGQIIEISSSTEPHVAMTYDQLGRLKTANDTSWSYDAGGNIVSVSPVAPSEPTTSIAYEYGDSDHPHAVTRVGQNQYTYDANGSMLTGGGREFRWNSQRHLVEATVAPWPAKQFAYDANGRRIRVEWDGAVTRIFGQWFERDADGELVKYYYAGSMLIARRHGLPTPYGDPIEWYHTDHLGSPRVVRNTFSMVTPRQSFSPFGVSSRNTYTDALVARNFTGHPLDYQAGIIYMNARYYDPQLGRFISADSLVPNPHNTQAFNRYSYAYNNPVSNVDPSGHAPVLAAGAAFGVVAAGVSTTLSTIAVIGAVTTVAGYATKNPFLATVGAVMLGYGTGYISPLIGGVQGGIVGGSIAAATSPLSPLSDSLKRQIGWAYTAAGVISSFAASERALNATSRVASDPSASPIGVQVDRVADRLQTATGMSQELKQQLLSGARESSDKFAGFAGSRPQVLYGMEVKDLLGQAGVSLTVGEAIALNPTGGLTGPGAGSWWFPSFNIQSGPLAVHSAVHDAAGFAKTFFNAGPGYGGLFATSPLSGQVAGITRQSGFMLSNSALQSSDEDRYR